jgi:hypothetical protein
MRPEGTCLFQQSLWPEKYFVDPTLFNEPVTQTLIVFQAVIVLGRRDYEHVGGSYCPQI